MINKKSSALNDFQNVKSKNYYKKKETQNRKIAQEIEGRSGELY